MTQHDFVEFVAEQVEQFPSVNKAAKAWGMSQQYLWAILHRERTPGPKILKIMGWEAVTDYHPCQQSSAPWGAHNHGDNIVRATNGGSRRNICP